MNDSNFNKADLEERLNQLENKLEAAKTKFAERSNRPAGTHMGHLLTLKDRHSQLKEEIQASDLALWQQMKLSWHKDVEGLAQSLERALEYEEEEFRKGQG